MTEATIQTIDAWSMSRLMDFESCPHRSYLAIIAKAPKPEYDEKHPMVRGRRVHTECEAYILGADDFPSTGKKLKELLDDCREHAAEGRATAEEKWGFTEEWDPCDWMADNVWLRMATDVYIKFDEDTGKIIDWKTGKSFGNEVKYMQQMQLYAVGAFCRDPELQVLEVTLGFLDEGKTKDVTFERGEKITKLMAKFNERGQRMTNCVDFRPKPNVVNCKYCPFGPAGTRACVYAAEPL